MAGLGSKPRQPDAKVNALMCSATMPLSPTVGANSDHKATRGPACANASSAVAEKTVSPLASSLCPFRAAIVKVPRTGRPK